MFNKVILIGNLTRDVELRYLPSGQALAKCGIATNRRYKDASGNQKDETMFIDFTVWGRSAEVANQYLRKGSRVLLEGRLTLEQWTDQNSQKRSRHSITVENLKMLDRRGEGPGGSGDQYAGGGYSEPTPPSQSYREPQTDYSQPSQPKPAGQPNENLPEIDINEDDIPF